MLVSRMAGILVAGAVVFALAGCSGEAMPTPTPTPTPVMASGDGVLRIGDMSPVTGPLAAFALAQAAGVELAVNEVNAAGGYNEAPIEVLHRGSGDGDPAVTDSSFADLAARGVDVIIAPASASVLAQLVPLAAAAGIALIAPASADNAPAGVDTIPAVPDDAFSARLRGSDPGLGDLSYGIEAYDLTIAAILGATLAEDDGGPSIAHGLMLVTGSGIPCSSYGMCLDVLTTQTAIDYVGLSGQINYSALTGVAYFGDAVDATSAATSAATPSTKK
jgi:branched-chain amino acid transport system substrate-binding protein